MSLLRRLPLGLKALRELGPEQLSAYAAYRLALISGALYRATVPRQSMASEPEQAYRIQPVLHLPLAEAIFSEPLEPIPSDLGTALPPRPSLKKEAAEIIAGSVRLFGGPPVPLQLEPPGTPAHWTAYELGRADLPAEDIKWTWEPARFGWAFTLGRAYLAFGDERCPQAFWRYFEQFQAANPPYQGLNWLSAQEVAFRLMALVFAAQIFAPSPHSSPDRLQQLGEAAAAHARRIPPSLAYARAQNNNHLLTEAAGLFTAGMALPGYPQSSRWQALGWKWFQRGLQQQIASSGTYVQHSANYHRLMLQLALWMDWLAQPAAHQRKWPSESLEKLSAAVDWLLQLTDRESGRTPNLGPNDGALFLPLSSCAFSDFRPTLQAAGRAFHARAHFPPGPWDELAEWVGGTQRNIKAQGGQRPLRLEQGASWMYLRAARFRSRPGHADQLHLDLWWQGLNVARDAGTFLYNAAPPWDNALAGTASHNTIQVNGLDQMTRAGRFLWLDRAQAEVSVPPDPSSPEITARHDGYERMGVIHLRSVNAEPGGWRVVDHLAPAGGADLGRDSQASLFWHLPDWPWRLDGAVLRLYSPYGWLVLRLESEPEAAEIRLARAGAWLVGEGLCPEILGWYAPTYGYKLPSLALVVDLTGPLPLHLVSFWQFPEPELDQSD